MIIHNIKRSQRLKDNHYSCGRDAEFSEYSIVDIKKLGVEWACYWYECGVYEGDGCLLMFKDQKWYTHTCGHCSCYGPTDELALREGFDSIGHMKRNGSEDFNKTFGILFECAEKYILEWS